jgi:CBS domain-containing protein
MSDGGPVAPLRGIAVFFILVSAVVVREVARLLVAAWLGLRLRAILLLPIGGLFAYANPESQEAATRGSGQFALAAAGPLANCATAVALAGLILGAGGNLALISRPLITATQLLRSMVWMQAGLGILHLLPAYPLDFGRILRGSFAQKHGAGAASRAATGLGQLLALGLMVAGMLFKSPWLIVAGFFIMIGAQVEDQGVFFQSVVDTVRMREVMLTDFATLSPSDTLADALSRCVHSLQEDFPVVRGPQLVGIVSRQRIVDALRAEGNGYVQSVMSRAFQVARPEDTLGTTIRRITAGHGLSLIPVTESGRVVGIVSVQNLMSSMSLLAEQRRYERQEAAE